MQQARPTDTSLSKQKSAGLTLFFNAIAAQGDTGHDTTHARIGI
jgi:hypothetical protein